jgi:hypothetical protein
MRKRLARRRLALAGVGVLASAVLAGCLALVPPPPPGVYIGLGFDSCAAPNTGQMGAWLSSPYHAIGIYLGGANRACGQPNLNAGWVNTVSNEGWRLAPLYVGLQAPCNGGFADLSWDPFAAYAQGASSADDAVNHAGILGLGGGTPIFLDMEAYAIGGSCSQAVSGFVNGWVVELHNQGYRAGFYSSGASGITDQVNDAFFPGYHSPDIIWFASWNGNSSVWGDRYVPNSMWTSHQRVHQYQGGHDESYGGVVLNIDNDAFDAFLAG